MKTFLKWVLLYPILFLLVIILLVVLAAWASNINVNYWDNEVRRLCQNRFTIYEKVQLTKEGNHPVK